MSALDKLAKAESALTEVQQQLTETERFNTGWRVDESLAGVRGAIWTLTHPMIDPSS